MCRTTMTLGRQGREITKERGLIRPNSGQLFAFCSQLRQTGFSLASRAQPRLAVGVEDVASDEITKSAPDHSVGGKMLQAGEAGDRNGGRCAIGQPLDPGFGIFVGDYTRRGPGESSMPGGKRAAQRIVPPDMPFFVALQRTLPPCTYLYDAVNRSHVSQSLQPQGSRLAGLRILGRCTRKP